MSAQPVRFKVQFAPGVTTERLEGANRAWFLAMLPPASEAGSSLCSALVSEIKREFGIPSHQDVSLYLDGCLIPPFLSSLVIREGCTVVVKPTVLGVKRKAGESTGKGDKAAIAAQGPAKKAKRDAPDATVAPKKGPAAPAAAPVQKRGGATADVPPSSSDDDSTDSSSSSSSSSSSDDSTSTSSKPSSSSSSDSSDSDSEGKGGAPPAAAAAEKPRASRSARRKATKRRLRRMGIELTPGGKGGSKGKGNAAPGRTNAAAAMKGATPSAPAAQQPTPLQQQRQSTQRATPATAPPPKATPTQRARQGSVPSFLAPESYPPLLRPMLPGDVVAYRLTEPGPCWVPTTHPHRFGRVLEIQEASNTVKLGPEPAGCRPSWLDLYHPPPRPPAEDEEEGEVDPYPDIKYSEDGVLVCEIGDLSELRLVQRSELQEKASFTPMQVAAAAAATAAKPATPAAAPAAAAMAPLAPVVAHAPPPAVAWQAFSAEIARRRSLNASGGTVAAAAGTSGAAATSTPVAAKGPLQGVDGAKATPPIVRVPVIPGAGENANGTPNGPGRMMAGPNGRDGTAGDKASPAAVAVGKGFARPPGGVRATALGPLLGYLRKVDGLTTDP